MPKFYVESGDVKIVIMASDALHAALKTFEQADGKMFGSDFWIDERGFRGPSSTQNITQQTVVHAIETWDDLDDMFSDMDEPDYDDPDFDTDYP